MLEDWLYRCKVVLGDELKYRKYNLSGGKKKV